MDITPLVTLPAVRGRSFLDLVADHWERGDAVFPVDPGLPDRERERVVTAVGDGPVPAGVAAVLLTSGTTGPPKGVMLSHDALRAAAGMCHRYLEATGGDRWVCCLPFHHIAGFSMLVRSAVLGTGPEIHPRFDPEMIGSTHGNLISLVPTMLTRLCDAGVDLSRFKTILLGGAAIPADLLRRAEDAGGRVVRTYGMTETCGGVVYDGTSLEGVQLKIREAERIAVKSPTLLSGYRMHGRVHDPLRKGWFLTSDRGRIEEGRLTVLGRTDAVIVTGGEKVDPDEVATIIEEHPAVASAEVFGAPDPEWGERVIATVVPARDVDPDELRAFVGARLPPYKVPKEIMIVDADQE
jgi:O-succinylbenzoic acid--CoA ligase